MEDQQQLKPCPFCGGKPRLHFDGVLAWGHCRTCGAEGGLSEIEADAITAWNRRASPSSSVLERAREALRFIVERENFAFAECSEAEAIWSKARSALAEIDRALGGGNAE